MKRILLILTATLFLANNVFADYFRVFYYIEGENIFYNAGNPTRFYAVMKAPFKYSTEAKTKGAAFEELMKNEPNAVAVTINQQ